MKKRVAVLGATGSIGRSTLDVIRADRDRFEVVLLSSHVNAEELIRLGSEFPGAVLALSGTPQKPQEYPGIRFFGEDGLLRAIAETGPQIGVNGIAGAAGLKPSLALLENRADLALANKETVVMAGPLVFAAAEKNGVKLLPVDSEHSAIFNLIEAHGSGCIEEILLTASGGPFRKRSAGSMAAITPKEALAHPTWSMGPKITIDSATMANKGLEVIEAVRLFGIDPGSLTVVVHPQSVVHSMVRLRDGAVYAQLSKPDMRHPIHNALYWPECAYCGFGRLSFSGLTLEFEKPDSEKFPMLPLAYSAARLGGCYPAAYNAANEEAVAAFLSGKIAFTAIPEITSAVLQNDWQDRDDSLNSILNADKKARETAQTYISEKYGCY
ncbi:1-deoxy-D-xylulose-5-phosphate reductoisomerase [Breznakiella homolactica]|uniref:1-deoxy-D-xylulose 5-phosphate reductoisomerase n=1 Tax=Breznakiella homolactica TaxID=2798577 RepID=A0A7T7XKI1_9SPIR|nr:1-deoxy-D-xylulose-5-phosphate reductoisomerase [Breznakiella homolactica]QQO08084.1 1-deoxy-D-xylulose-5-phosphate reductoisomerase [Breznakiella homolactica]